MKSTRVLHSIDSTKLTLLSAQDARVFDFLKDQYLPLGPGEGDLCDCCGEEHPQMYVIECKVPYKLYHVGRRCFRMFTAWRPEKNDLKAVEHEAKERAYEDARRAVMNQVLERVLTMDLGSGDPFELRCQAIKQVLKTIKTRQRIRNLLYYHIRALLANRMQTSDCVSVLDTQEIESHQLKYKIAVGAKELSPFCCLECTTRQGLESAPYLLYGGGISGLCVVHAIEFAWQHGMNLPSLPQAKRAEEH